MISTRCPRCKITYQPGMAIQNTARSHPDDLGAGDCCTVTMDGPPEMILCWKCPQCGHSIQCPPCPPCNRMTVLQYLRGLKVGERVVETDKSSCLRGRCGTIYESKTGGGPCVLWDKRGTEEGQMGTSVTGGTRRLSEWKLVLDPD